MSVQGKRGGGGDSDQDYRIWGMRGPPLPPYHIFFAALMFWTPQFFLTKVFLALQPLTYSKSYPSWTFETLVLFCRELHGNWTVVPCHMSPMQTFCLSLMKIMFIQQGIFSMNINVVLQKITSKTNIDVPNKSRSCWYSISI